MDFGLSADQEKLRAETRAFARSVVAPSAEERSRNSRWDKDLWLALGRHRLMAAVVPEEFGGLGKGAIEHAIIVEELSRVDASIGAATNLMQQTNMALLSFATMEQKKHYLPRLATGRAFSMTGITESASGSKFTDMQTTAVQDGDDWIINGSKTEVHIPQFVEICLVFAKTKSGITAFLVETSNPGFRHLYDREIIGLRGIPMSAVAFENCRVPARDLLGREGGAYDVFFKSFDLSRIGNAAKCIGIAEGALEQSIAYAKKRHVGDNVVTDFQGLRWRLAELVTRIEASRLLMYRAATAYDSDGRSTGDSAKAKLLACTTAMDAATIGLQITGSHGCFSENPFGRFLMDAKVSEITGGTVEILLNTIARDLLGKPIHPTN